MLEVKYSTRFKKDLKVCQKRHYDMNLLQQVINVLAVPAALQPQNKDHSLTGSYIPHRECHIQPDWLLIYYQTDTELYLYRTGTHADLFGLKGSTLPLDWSGRVHCFRAAKRRFQKLS